MIAKNLNISKLFKYELVTTMHAVVPTAWAADTAQTFELQSTT